VSLLAEKDTGVTTEKRQRSVNQWETSTEYCSQYGQGVLGILLREWIQNS